MTVVLDYLVLWLCVGRCDTARAVTPVFGARDRCRSRSVGRSDPGAMSYEASVLGFACRLLLTPASSKFGAIAVNTPPQITHGCSGARIIQHCGLPNMHVQHRTALNSAPSSPWVSQCACLRDPTAFDSTSQARDPTARTHACPTRTDTHTHSLTAFSIALDSHKAGLSLLAHIKLMSHAPDKYASRHA